MKPLSLLVILLSPLACFGQSKIDSIQTRIDSTSASVRDALTMPDSLKTSWHKVDSVRQSFNASADSLNQKYQRTIQEFDAQTAKLNAKIDSLEKLQLPTNSVTRKVDSLNNLRNEKIGEFNGKLSALKSKTIGKLDHIEMTPGMEGPVSEFTGKINAIGLSPQGSIGLPQVQVPGYDLPNVNALSSKLQTQNLPGLSDIKTPVGDLSQVTDQVKGVSADIEKISTGNINDVEQIPQAIEQQATKIDGVSELQKQSGVVEVYKTQLQDFGDQEAVKKQAVELAKKEAVNHFAGKEAQLKEAMDKVSKYKAKYSSVESVKDLPKRPPNGMKGKPLIERIVPGVYFQVQQKNQWLIDVNPYAGYRISGRFMIGAGWNQRFAYDNKANGFNADKRIFGPRAFLDTRLGKGFIAHLEGEYMNTFVPTNGKSLPEVGRREWATSVQLGLKKEYKIYKALHGTVLLQYNFVNQYFKTPYVDRLNSRIGFEYMLRKKKREEAKEAGK